MTDGGARYVDTEAGLAGVARAIAGARVLAVDTESNSLYVYREQVCFVQLAAGRKVFLIDTVALRDLAPIAGALEDPAIRKIFHAADYDVICLKRDFGIRVRNLFDTMIAAQILGEEQLGLAAQLERHFGTRLDKSLTRHDWGARPLAPEHLRYLTEDVTHLEGLAGLLEQRLREADLLEEAELEFERVAAQEPRSGEWPDPEGFRRIKGAQDLDRSGLSILRELYLLRETLAAKLDRPPFRVVGNAQLLAISLRRPRSARDLLRIHGMTPKVLRAWGEPLLEAVERGLANAGALAFRLPRPERPPPVQAAAEDALREWRRGRMEAERRPSLAVLPNHVLARLAARRPETREELAAIEGLGRSRLEKYGDEILTVLRAVPKSPPPRRRR